MVAHRSVNLNQSYDNSNDVYTFKKYIFLKLTEHLKNFHGTISVLRHTPVKKHCLSSNIFICKALILLSD